jgi:hypothetical protein
MGQTRKQRKQALGAALQEMVVEGQGVWQLLMYRTEDCLGALLNPSWSPKQGQVLKLFAELARAIGQAPAKQPWLCFTCDAGFRMPFEMPELVVVLKPDAPEPISVLVQGLCPACANRDKASKDAAIMRALNHHMFAGEARTFDPHPAGHA